MELRTLKYFLTVAAELNITHAAHKLNISQPPLSRQLSQLEEELGVQLFVRGKRKIQLTEEGKYLAQQAEHILNLAEHTAKQLNLMKQETVKGTLLLGVTETCSASVLPAILPGFKTLYPQISYDIWCGNSNDVCRRIKEGIADIGIVRAPLEQQKFETVFLKTETWIAIVSKNHPLAKEACVSLERLSREPLFIPSRQPLQREILNWFSSASESYQIFALYNQLAGIIPLIAQNTGVAICPESVKLYTDDRRLAYLKITEPEPTSHLYMICGRNRLLPAGAKAFWNYVKQSFSEADEPL
ncbi:LysR family transcriptional regulator [Clostridium transplantifaecale]|uniref:LysR family transcriptional regulator n=1 Tax=Clostridium transplantifaecale TaxID=2479838 RepID=UPI000F63FD60|nr:LysR family transcriptional regulator [Clostridium transplantifaecale]